MTILGIVDGKITVTCDVFIVSWTFYIEHGSRTTQGAMMYHFIIHQLFMAT